jgi:glycosyltransferase involved in cell wall biosynthesis
MKVLHINSSDIGGGAAIAGCRLHQGLLAQGVESSLLVGSATINSDRIAQVPPPSRWEKRALFHITHKLGFNYIHQLSSFQLLNHPFFQAADVLNFHNLHGGYFNYLAIPKLTQAKPTIFTLHDMWSFTGHCVYSHDCARWQTGCGNCPDLKTYPAISRDTSSLEWRLKNWGYHRSNLTVVAPSYWLFEQAKQSMLNRFPIHHIPYGIDTETYQPIASDLARKALDLPLDKKILLFSAANLEDSRKGGDLLQIALKKLPESLKADTILLTFGNTEKPVEDLVGIRSVSLGYISSDRLKAYSAADLFVFPTRADNLPLVLQESMACGTPMVSFKVGGVPDLVRHGLTGYLAAREDPQDFCQGIVQLLEDQALRGKMAENCRTIALKEYALELQSERYVALYNKMLEGKATA